MILRKYFIFFLIPLLSGCSTLPLKTSDLPDIKAIQEPRAPLPAPPKVEEGSLWSEGDGIMFYSHKRARKVGDVITVRIVEDPEAELNANTKTSRSSNIEAKLKFLGYMKALAESNRRLAQVPGEDDLIKASLGSSFDGKGTSDRDGHVKAYVAAVVGKVLPNGNLYINGKREIKVNNETQYITISGIVRPEDVSATNEISSTYVANARITYSGIGPVADKQKPGWLGRVVDHVWPF
ncbi:MAG: flagellar basal body L-ring protein FlgH [Deltaproteobacteria bacterium]|nr:flagellar basal body L-ring protein FlgH [Deltaproteobacteria bacterium]RLB96153.1 MAG: flagellar basal body L-ring protein FlgH [Deltaproteobacteria bacterium]